MNVARVIDHLWNAWVSPSAHTAQLHLKQPILFSPEITLAPGWTQAVLSGVLGIVGVCIGALLQSRTQGNLERQRLIEVDRLTARHERRQLLREDITQLRLALRELGEVHGVLMIESYGIYHAYLEAYQNWPDTTKFLALSNRISLAQQRISVMMSTVVSEMKYDIQDDYQEYMKGAMELLNKYMTTSTAVLAGSESAPSPEILIGDLKSFLEGAYRTITRKLWGAIESGERELQAILDGTIAPDI